MSAVYALQALPPTAPVFVIDGGSLCEGRILKMVPWTTDPGQVWVHVLTTDGGGVATTPDRVWTERVPAVRVLRAQLANQVASLDLEIAEAEGNPTKLKAARDKSSRAFRAFTAALHEHAK